MERKCILLVRVSTDKQGTKAQRDELVAFVKNEGYSIREMDIIRNTESASQDEDLKGLEQLKKDIDRYPIRHFYVWELSRISRHYRVLEQFRDLCINRKINLTMKLERLTLLNPDGSINEDALDAYERYKMQVYREGKIRDARVKRGIQKAASQNRWLGGKDVLFGYAVDNKKHYQLEPKESQIVKDVFDLYATGSHSFSTIEKEILSLHSFQLDRKNLGRILNNRYYTGEKILKAGYVYARQYPVIISTETFEQCQNLLKQRSNRKQDKSKNVYYAGKILSCNCCQSRLTAFGTNNNYACKNFHEKKGCTNGTSINLNVVDSLALKVAWDKDYSEQKNINADTIIKVENSIKVLQTKIDVAGSKLETIRQTKQKQFKKILTHLSDSDIQKQVELSLKIDKQQIDFETIGYKNEIERLNKFLESKKSYITIDDGTKYQFTYKYPQVFIKDMSDKQRYDLVHQYVKNIAIRDISPTTKEIAITTYCNETSVFQYNNKKKDKKQRLIEIIDNKSNPINWDKHIIERTF